MKKILGLLVVLSFVGCTTKKEDVATVVGCAVEGAVVTATAAVVATELGCTSLDAVKVDVKEIVAKANLCKPKPTETAAPVTMAVGIQTSSVGQILCAPIVDGLVAKATAQIPAAWSCTGNGKPDLLKKALTDACLKNL